MNKRIKIYVGIIILVVILLIAIIIGRSHAEILANDGEVEPNSELTYYLKVKYDGVDRDGIESSDSVTANINSGTIVVNDKIPDGLTFTGFVTTSDGAIGAVKRSDGTTSCYGNVIDDTNDASTSSGTWNSNNTEYTYHGLHYNANNRLVSFKVKGLKAGCELTVGIKTQIPSSVDDPNTTVVEKRRDFYNYASARENELTTNSNIVHAYMGSSEETMYNVTYSYTGTVPSGAPSAPVGGSYAENSVVGVASSPSVEGYTFSGWTTTNATVNNGSFVMPGSNVNFVGSFTKIDTKKVTYTISGDSPEGYVVPLEKEYYPGTVVDVDSLKPGDIFNGYKFLGWTSTDVTISSDGDFEMPNSNVVITGSWEEVKYKVTYRFYDGVLPPNSESLLPTEKTYAPGTTVTLEDVTEPTGYVFLGWYKENNFEMPSEDVVIYGEWKRQTGTFEPTISKTITNLKDYRAGDTVNFDITVTNTASFAIKDVIVKESTEGAKFINGTGYTVSSDHFANIASIPAGGSVVLKASYTVKSTDRGTVENIAEIKGALADNNYELKDKEYKATAEFTLKTKLKICKEVSGSSTDNTFQFKVEGTNGFNTWVVMKKNECKTIYVDPSTYKITEIVPQEYTLQSVSGDLTSNAGDLVVTSDKDYEVTFNNKFTQKGFMHSFGRVVNKVLGGN